MSTATLTAPQLRPRAPRRVPAAPSQRRAPQSQSTPAPLRLTRRGRLVVLLVVLAVACAGFALLGGPAVSTSQTHHAAAHTVVVRGGETLWDIASRIAPDQDPRVVIADIVDLNHLPDAGSIRLGQEIFIPAY